MTAVKHIVFGAGRLLRAILLMKWEPIPFVGVGLVSVWIWWIALALSK